MLRLVLLITLFSSAIFSFSNCTDQHSNHVLILEYDNEDYGCVHDDHSQYDDGDSLNLEAASYNL